MGARQVYKKNRGVMTGCITGILRRHGTGEYWNINCGPACVTMAMKWADSSFNLAPADARAYFPQNTALGLLVQ